MRIEAALFGANCKASKVGPNVAFDAGAGVPRSRREVRSWPGAEIGSRARILHLHRTGEAHGFSAHGSSTLNTGQYTRGR